MEIRRRYEVVVTASGDDERSVVRQLREAADLFAKMKGLESTFEMTSGDPEGSFKMRGTRDEGWTREKYSEAMRIRRAGTA